jgi:hypothetical protein
MKLPWEYRQWEEAEILRSKPGNQTKPQAPVFRQGEADNDIFYLEYHAG